MTQARSRLHADPQMGLIAQPVFARHVQLIEVIAVGHCGENLHGAVALLDGNAELHAFNQAAHTFGFIALCGTDEAFGDDTRFIGQGQHDAALKALNAQVDPVLGLKGVSDELKRVVHGLLPSQEVSLS